MSSPPWFRFYSEITRDRKIDRICRATEHPRCLVIGAWSVLMAMANDSPIRGVLLLTDDMPYTLEDIADEIGLPVNTATILLDEFQRFHMLHEADGIFYLTNWDKRQFSSDSSTDRVRKYRERQRQEDDTETLEETDTVTAETEDGNADETLHGRYGNAPEQNRAESEQNRSESPAVAGKMASSGDGRAPPGLTEGQRYWLRSFGAKRFATNVQKEAVLMLEQTYGTNTLAEGVQWAAKQGMNMGRAVIALETALKKWNRKNNTDETVTVKGL